MRRRSAVTAGTVGVRDDALEAQRCIKRYLARRIWQLIEHGTPTLTPEDVFYRHNTAATTVAASLSVPSLH